MVPNAPASATTDTSGTGCRITRNENGVLRLQRGWHSYTLPETTCTSLVKFQSNDADIMRYYQSNFREH
ncbi:hypothetical protein AYI69_g11185 [Smittium culicis]|uniref:Uncharacterized protein n=1 Tax=Smittium culicis TaxID=133412 RepID=A0A1R1X0I9_9FUNG|nr:hypothetical protein AYI69_g11416 [Smittium culicis]OMJ08129.1 hypothetical protein AYI69_g11185 [Smittium culicis]